MRAALAVACVLALSHASTHAASEVGIDPRVDEGEPDTVTAQPAPEEAAEAAPGEEATAEEEVQEGSEEGVTRESAQSVGLDEVVRLLGSATTILETYHRRFESSLNDMSAERILQTIRGANLLNGVILVLYAPLTAFVSLVSGRLCRCLHATYAGLSGWALVSAEVPTRGSANLRPRWLASQLGRSTTLVFAATVVWSSGPVGAGVAVLTTLNAAFNVYAAAVHPAFREEMREAADVAKGLAAVGRQVWRAGGRVFNTAMSPTTRPRAAGGSAPSQDAHLFEDETGDEPS